MDVHQRRRIGDRRVAAVEDADLHQFIGTDILDEGDADLLQRGASGREIVLQDPLLEGFAEDRPIVFEAEALDQEAALAVRGGGRDAVHHAVRESRRSRAATPPARDRRGRRARRTASAVTLPLCGMLSQDITVKGGVPSARRRASPARMSPNTVRGRSGSPASRRCRDGRVEDPRGGIDVVAALGDGHGDDADRRVGQPIDDGGAVARGDEIHHGTCDPRLDVPGILLHHGGQPVLRLEALAAGLLGREHAGTDDRPVAVAPGIEQRRRDRRPGGRGGNFRRRNGRCRARGRSACSAVPRPLLEDASAPRLRASPHPDTPFVPPDGSVRSVELPRQPHCWQREFGLPPPVLTSPCRRERSDAAWSGRATGRPCRRG